MQTVAGWHALSHRTVLLDCWHFVKTPGYNAVMPSPRPEGQARHRDSENTRERFFKPCTRHTTGLVVPGVFL